MKLLWNRAYAYLGFRRRWFATLAAAVSMWCLISALQPLADTPGPTVLTLATAVPVGHTIREGDVHARRVPLAVVPDGALDLAEATACVTVAALPTGSILTRHSCVGPAALHVPAGKVLSTVRLSDTAALALLRQGSTIDVIASGDAGAETIATGARVVSLPSEKASTSSFAAKSDDPVLIVALSSAEAKALTVASGRRKLSVSVVSA